ncbi:hypothetical protein [Wenyingzhuangia sp. 2_MG-2023]|uniref:hypothetical protein n=1 Tax=Wenyingzhuangia sp. 2_MG-2023 TaxID=3062639 RepID=UPI0026E2C9B7|nr:hypothetical protein [Wenyingzhuangia sp. 2_MG-2023]MDO6737778.1 hypothetical protein [Wenyingzhuangia sp. 2_MG-2023]
MINNIIFKKIVIVVLLFQAIACADDNSSIDTVEPDSDQITDSEEFDPATIHSVISFENPGKLIDVFFYDVKYAARNTTNATTAYTIFKEDGLNGLRVSILGTDKDNAHPSEGVVDEAVYERFITSINLAKAVRGNDDTYVFASKKLEGQGSFPDWVKGDDGIIPEKYAILVADFLEFMKSKNVKIDYLGIDNEYVYNEGNITPQKYAETIAELRSLAIERDFDIPVLVGYEDFGPNKNKWVKTLFENGWGDTMEIYGTHYYPKYRPKANLVKDLDLVGNMPFWSTEPHWDTKGTVNDFDEAEQGIVALWDQIDVGMTGFMWWDLNYNASNVRKHLIRAISVPLLGARPIQVTDIDGEDITDLGKLQTRAFIEDKTITVFAVNMNTTVRDDYTFQVKDASIDGGVRTIHWTDGGVVTGTEKLIDVEGEEDNIFMFTLPERSISRFTFKIK